MAVDSNELVSPTDDDDELVFVRAVCPHHPAPAQPNKPVAEPHDHFAARGAVTETNVGQMSEKLASIFPMTCEACGTDLVFDTVTSPWPLSGADTLDLLADTDGFFAVEIPPLTDIDPCPECMEDADYSPDDVVAAEASYITVLGDRLVAKVGRTGDSFWTAAGLPATRFPAIVDELELDVVLTTNSPLSSTLAAYHDGAVPFGVSLPLQSAEHSSS